MKKNIIVFHVGTDVKDPINIVRPDIITGVEADNEVPLLAVYDGVHYESVYPASEMDQYLTRVFVVKYPGFKGDCFKTFIKETVFVGQKLKDEEKKSFAVDDYEKKRNDTGTKSRQEINTKKMIKSIDCVNCTKAESMLLIKKESTGKETSGKMKNFGLTCNEENINKTQCCSQNEIDSFQKGKEEGQDKKKKC